MSDRKLFTFGIILGLVGASGVDSDGITGVAMCVVAVLGFAVAWCGYRLSILKYERMCMEYRIQEIKERSKRELYESIQSIDLDDGNDNCTGCPVERNVG